MAAMVMYVNVCVLTSIAWSWPQRAAHVRGARCWVCRVGLGIGGESSSNQSTLSALLPALLPSLPSLPSGTSTHSPPYVP